MEFQLKNVGKIREANIELNGITVIAGENNTGKSTVGKMLYCVMNAFHRIDEKVEKERRDAIEEIMVWDCISDFKKYQSKKNDFIRQLLDLDRKNLDRKDVYVLYREYFQDEVLPQQIAAWEMSRDQIIDKLYIYLMIDEHKIVNKILEKYLKSEFNMNLRHVNYKVEESSIRLIAKELICMFKANVDDSILIEEYKNVSNGLVYIDSPYVLDSLCSENNVGGSIKHRDNLLEMLKINGTNKINALDEIIIAEKLQNIMKIFNNVFEGELCASEDSDTFVLRSKSLRQPLDIVNLSTGLKTFVILRTLIQNGSIKEGDVVVLDEPEIHLHPEWQLRFAELIVLLQKEFHLRILLNTHSPYFLNAIEVFSMHYRTADKCKYYLTQGNHNDERIDIVDVTDNVEKIYEKLARPLQDLENMGYKYE